MKDIVITKKRIVLETVFIISCLFLTEGLNFYAIKKFQTHYDELWSQWLTILILTALFYGLFIAARIALKLALISFKAMMKKLSNQKN